MSLLYESLGGTPVARSSFYDWFDAELACLLGELAQRAIARVQEVEQRRRERSREDRLLERISDVRIIDSSSQVLSRLCARWSPSTSTVRPAGVKLHAIIALDSPIVHAYEISPQRVHDSKHLSAADFEPGTLALYDLGYVNHERESAMVERGVDILRRLKDSEQPVIEGARVGLVRPEDVRPEAFGKRLDDALLAGDLAANGIIDVDVRMGARYPWRARLIGLPAPDGDTHWFLTTLGPDAIDAADAQELYALRWEVEIIFKALKSALGLDKIRARRPDSLIALLHAKVIALALARLLHLSTRPDADDVLTPPRHLVRPRAHGPLAPCSPRTSLRAFTRRAGANLPRICAPPCPISQAGEGSAEESQDGEIEGKILNRSPMPIELTSRTLASGISLAFMIVGILWTTS